MALFGKTDKNSVLTQQAVESNPFKDYNVLIVFEPDYRDALDQC